MEGFRLEGSTKRTPAGTGWGGAAGLHMLVVGAAMDRLIKPFCGGKKNVKNLEDVSWASEGSKFTAIKTINVLKTAQLPRSEE